MFMFETASPCEERPRLSPPDEFAPAPRADAKRLIISM